MKKLPIHPKKRQPVVAAPAPKEEISAIPIKPRHHKHVSFCVFCYAEKTRTRLIAKETVPDSFVGQITYSVDGYSYVHVMAHDHEEALTIARALIFKKEPKPTAIKRHEWIFEGTVIHP